MTTSDGEWLANKIMEHVRDNTVPTTPDENAEPVDD